MKRKKYVPVKAERDKLKPWNYSFSCWEEKESSVSLADIPLNLIHYCVVTLLSPHAGNWASCRALKYPDGRWYNQQTMIKYESSAPTGVALSSPPAWTANQLYRNFSWYFWANCESYIFVRGGSIQATPSPWGSHKLKAAKCGLVLCTTLSASTGPDIIENQIWTLQLNFISFRLLCIYFIR